MGQSAQLEARSQDVQNKEKDKAVKLSLTYQGEKQPKKATAIIN